MLEVRQIEVKRSETTLRYDFTLNEGKVLIVRGPSGVGKSTLLDAIAGFVQIDAGRIYWQGQAINDLAARYRPVTSMFQHNNLFNHLSVSENLAAALPQLSRSEHLRKLTMIELEAFFHQPCSQLSGGQLQRISLLTSLLRPEPLILLDEPFSALDQGTSKRIQRWLHSQIVSLQKTVLLVSHDDRITREEFSDIAETLDLSH